MEDFKDPALKSSKWDRVKGREAMKQLDNATFFASIDAKHRDLVVALHWMKTLAEYVGSGTSPPSFLGLPPVQDHRKEINNATHREPKVYLLGTSNASEAILSGVKDALIDFFAGQLGMGEAELKDKLFIASGDGITLSNMIRVKAYMETTTQSHYKGMRFLLSQLERCHT